MDPQQLAQLSGHPHAAHAAANQKNAHHQNPELHHHFQRFQEGEITIGKFVEEIGGRDAVPLPVLRMLQNDPQITFAKFLRAWSEGYIDRRFLLRSF